MPGPILHQGAVVTCSHGGVASPTAPVPRVLVSSMPVATIAAPWVIAGCPFVPPPNPGPCVTGQWVVGATRVMALGQPVAILGGVSVCAPTGTPMIPSVAQTRVIAM
jgi:uncharacterized Zn-binding protein involved in type VI secretion